MGKFCETINSKSIAKKYIFLILLLQYGVVSNIGTNFRGKYSTSKGLRTTHEQERHRTSVVGIVKASQNVSFKAVVYAMDLVARVVLNCRVAAAILENPYVFDRVRRSMVYWCYAYIACNGENFEHLLQH